MFSWNSKYYHDITEKWPIEIGGIEHEVVRPIKKPWCAYIRMNSRGSYYGGMPIVLGWYETEAQAKNAVEEHYAV